MFRLLVVEDQEEFYQEYLLRQLTQLLRTERLSITHAATLEAACQALVEPWDAILMDYTLGPRISFLDTPIRDGADLVTFRRAVEKERKLKVAIIVGISSNFVGNRMMRDRGAQEGFSKLEVGDMAQYLCHHFPQLQVAKDQGK